MGLPESVELIDNNEPDCRCDHRDTQIGHPVAEAISQRNPQIRRNDGRTGFMRDRQQVGRDGEVMHHANAASPDRFVGVDNRTDQQRQGDECQGQS